MNSVMGILDVDYVHYNNVNIIYYIIMLSTYLIQTGNQYNTYGVHYNTQAHKPDKNSSVELYYILLKYNHNKSIN